MALKKKKKNEENFHVNGHPTLYFLRVFIPPVAFAITTKQIDFNVLYNILFLFVLFDYDDDDNGW